ncbi:2345_t:CDS:2 [Funneliformis geosporum]|nr:2345_t:CDS:2 [Funneliformis geosporum]
MTKKSDLQQELLEKVKPGRKPSDIKRLKRSKSDKTANQALQETKQLLDNSLEARTNALLD